MIKPYLATSGNPDKRRFVFLFFIVLGFQIATAQRPGTLENTVTGVSTPVVYTQVPTNILNTYQEVYRVTTPGGKLLYEVTLVHDQAAEEIRCSVVPQEPFEPRVKKYDPIRTGIFFSNKADLDTNISQQAKFDESYTFICSFGDTMKHGFNYRTDPFLHKLQIEEGLFILLDPISAKRVERHKQYVYKAIEQINFEAKRKAQIEEENRRKQEANTRDSVQKLESIRAAQKLQDSLLYEQFVRSILTDAEGFYKEWREDTDMVTQIHQKILARYGSLLEKFESTKVAGEWYYGDKRQRKKQGVGFSMNDSHTFRDGYFNEDTFVSGKAIIWSVEKAYVGEIVDGQNNGLGMLKRSDGSYLIGHFEGSEFADGVSNWTSNQDKSEHYFGGFSKGEKNGFGELSYKQDSLYVGIFKRGILQTGIVRKTGPNGDVFFKVENGVYLPLDIWVSKRFFNELDLIKKKSTELSNVIYEGKIQPIRVDTSYKKSKYKILNYIGVSMGVTIPAFGFNQNPTYAGVGPQASIDAWFRFSNQIGFRMKMGMTLPTVSNQYQTDFNERHSSNKVFYNNKMHWLIHYYDIGLGLNLGRKVVSLELAALGGLSIVHQPRFNIVSGNEGLVVGKVSWNIIGETSLRFNCTKKFAFRFGATYLLTSIAEHRGYYTNNNGGLEDWNGDNIVGDTKTIWIHSINPFISFVGLF